jgi:prepilin-type N-terminal cleavage/methylation domain-containing protein
MIDSRQKGFTLVEIVVVVLVIGLLGFIGVRVWGNYTSQQLAKDTTPTTASVQPIKTAKDVQTVENQLDSIDVVGSFENDLNSAASF